MPENLLRLAAAIVVSATALAASAVNLEPGDLVIAGRILGPNPAGPQTTQLLVYSPAGTAKGFFRLCRMCRSHRLASSASGTMYAR
jgi:2-keto-4-pentenoate hydratase